MLLFVIPAVKVGYLVGESKRKLVLRYEAYEDRVGGDCDAA